MTYTKLFTFCQTQKVHVKRNTIKEETLNLVGKPKVSVMMTGVDLEITRGFFVSARNTDHPLVQKFGTDIIVLARGMNRCWTRFVMIKELMHIFDDPAEQTSTDAEFDTLMTDLTSGNTPGEWAPQMRSENRCHWMALALFCPEDERQDLLQKRDKKEITDYEIALRLRIPELYVRNLFRPNFTGIVQWLRDRTSAG